MSGWIRLHRKIQDHWLWGEKPFDKRSAWLDILMMVNHEDKKTLLGNELIEIKRGSRITSIRQLCDRWGWSNTKTINFLKLLEKDGMIAFKSDSKKTVLKVVNYNDYQTNNNDKNDSKTTEERHEGDTKATRKHTNKNDKNDKNDKEVYKYIVEYLNQKTGRRFSYKAKPTTAKIHARLEEGFTLDDFKKVVDIKSSEWLNDANMQKYLRPETLFGNKFEGYLNQGNAGGANNGKTRRQHKQDTSKYDGIGFSYEDLQEL